MPSLQRKEEPEMAVHQWRAVELSRRAASRRGRAVARGGRIRIGKEARRMDVTAHHGAMTLNKMRTCSVIRIHAHQDPTTSTQQTHEHTSTQCSHRAYISNRVQEFHVPWQGLSQAVPTAETEQPVGMPWHVVARSRRPSSPKLTTLKTSTAHVLLHLHACRPQQRKKSCDFTPGKKVRRSATRLAPNAPWIPVTPLYTTTVVPEVLAYGECMTSICLRGNSVVMAGPTHALLDGGTTCAEWPWAAAPAAPRRRAYHAQLPTPKR